MMSSEWFLDDWLQGIDISVFHLVAFVSLFKCLSEFITEINCNSSHVFL